MKTLLAFSFCLFGFVGSLAAQPAAGANINYIEFQGGTFGNGKFSGFGSVWDTISPLTWMIGVSGPDAASPLLNSSDTRVNIAPGTYYTYVAPTLTYGFATSFGSALQVIIGYTDNRPFDVAVFTPGPLSPATPWSRISGSSAISISSTGLLNVGRVGQGRSLASNVPNYVLQLTVSGTGSGAGGGANINGIVYTGGTLSSNGTFLSWANRWDTVPGGSWMIGVTLPDPAAPLLNSSDTRINIPPGTYYTYVTQTLTYGYPTSFGGALHVTISYADNRPDDAAVFTTGPISPATPWSRVSGSPAISISSTGLLNVGRVGGDVPSSNVPNYVLQLTVEGTGTGGGGTPGAGGKCGGTCSVSSPGQAIGAAGGAGSISVTATSSWDAVAVDTWITITSGGSGSGNGSVGFTVSANTGAPRSGTILVAGQTYAVHQGGTPSGTTAGCSYNVPSSVPMVAVGGTTSGLIQVVTAQTCSWTATKSASWITIRSGASATGNGAVAYTVSPNDTGNPRSAAIVIAGQMVAINQAGGSLPVPAGTPSVSAGGVVNTASYAPGGPPNGSLAQGSFFSIYGSDLGPEEFAKASSYPLPKTLGGVGVQIKLGSNTYDAYLVFASKGQINAVLPSNVPIGDAQLTVTYNGKTSAPANIRIAKTSFGVFFQRVSGKDLAIAQNVASATDYPLNLPDTPAKPGQIVILWGTGLGPISGADNGAPGGGDMTGVPVAITVGGVSAPRVYAGRQPETAAVDNIYFTVPAGVPYGCQVPVAITAGGVAANATVIAITASGSPCQ